MDTYENRYSKQALKAFRLLSAAQKGDWTAVEMLVESGANPSVTDECKRTIFHILMMKGDFKNIKNMYYTLIKLGADPNAKDRYGKTPSDYFERRNYRNKRGRNSYDTSGKYRNDRSFYSTPRRTRR
ncbi:MAG: hypothetical protein ISN28_04385 [Ectothiorhodospiraceae bacterium AqS1]|nr:hypothetical protein [Ectothiorhodospiraceae bacterium AqS1]